jgi:eukaryotic-like serine/threonine-protein kinase
MSEILRIPHDSPADLADPSVVYGDLLPPLRPSGVSELGESCWQGQVIDGRYTVERVLGTGGMGVVLAARHNVLGHLAAIKVMHPEFAREPELVARFIREGQAVVRLRSEHVVRVTDVGIHQGIPFLVMELLEGMDLGTWLERYGGLPLDIAIDWFLQAAEAIAEAHAAKILHRDIKPGNLFVAESSLESKVIKVLDFGIARLSSGSGAEPAATRVGMVMGSPEYMSPEQVNGAADMDERADIWALGCLLFEMVTGQSAWTGNSEVATMASVLRDPSPSVRTHTASLPPRVDQVVQTCLSKDRNQRYPSVGALVQELTPLANEEGIARIRRMRGSDHHSVRPRFQRTLVGLPDAPSPVQTPVELEGAREATQVSFAGQPTSEKVSSRLVATVVSLVAAALLAAGGIGWALAGTGTASDDGHAGIPVASTGPQAFVRADVPKTAVADVTSSPVADSASAQPEVVASAAPAQPPSTPGNREKSPPKPRANRVSPGAKTSSIPNHGGRE